MYKIALCIRDADSFLIATVVRVGATDVYVNWPRNHIKGWKPHTSYHASGRHHQKSFGKAFNVRQEQKPNTTFKNTRNVISFPVATDHHKKVNTRVQPRDFDATFEILVEQLRPEKHVTYVYADLVEPGKDPLLSPGAFRSPAGHLQRRRAVDRPHAA